VPLRFPLGAVRDLAGRQQQREVVGAAADAVLSTRIASVLETRSTGVPLIDHELLPVRLGE
jgi:hypothetical protein